MAPRGKDDRSLIAPMSPSIRLQDYTHKKNLSFDDVELILKDLVANADDSHHSELLLSLEKFLRKTEKLNTKIEQIDGDSAILSACSLSVRDATALMLDQVASLYESGDVEASAATVVATKNTKRSIKFIDMIENTVSQPPNEKLETRLQKLLESEGTGETWLRLSSWSSSLAFEFHAGVSDSNLLYCESQESLPLTVYAEPIIFASAADMLAENNPIDSYTALAMKVEYCSHKSLACSLESHQIGEATIRVYVTPGSLSRSKEMPIWGRDDDVNKMRVVEARAIQQNAFPKMPQVNPDLFVSSTYGENGLSVTMKVPTYHIFDNQAPYIRIQLVLEPPTPES